MIAWEVHASWYGTENIVIGIYSNSALAALAAMRYVNEENGHSYTNNEYPKMKIRWKRKRSWGYKLFYETCFNYSDLCITFERVTVNDSTFL